MRRIFFISKRKVLMIIVAAVLIILSIFGYVRLNDNATVFDVDEALIYKGSKDDKIIALTCNVDWGEEYIPDMLKILEQNNVKITFFVTGTWAKKNPEVLKSIYKAGHEIGNHGYFHEKYGNLSYTQNTNEIKKAENIINSIINVKCKYFAPPSGHYSDNTIKAAKALNYKIIMWSIDTIDWRNDSTKDIIIKRVLSKACNSGIVLMHPKPETIKALPIIIEELRKKGYKLGTITDIINPD
ncbi:polysaccharide deacetylase family protein [Abyssisolibacter fermentans]|uniref:polysaccharide deacetylase family protein n=1 Tax=Abyssisolibacter fermentans TaxID=1766203 RepID=UPI0008299FCF|nr:polysaccharide deacetylase family protein [Abyssisolibacter fermentans]